MAYTYDAGKARLYYSLNAEVSTWGSWAVTPATINAGAHLMPDTPTVGSPTYDQLTNSGLLKNQGEWAGDILRGRHITIYEPTLPMTAKLGRFVQSSFGGLTDGGSDAYTRTSYGTGGYTHACALGNVPTPFTIDTKLNGPTDITTGYLFTGCWVKSWTISWQNGGTYVSFKPRIVMSRHYSAGISRASIEADPTTYYSPYAGIAPTKLGLWVDQNVAHNSDWDGSVTAMTSAGIPTGSEDLTGDAINLMQFCRSGSLTYDTGVNEDDLFAAGFSSAAGVFRAKPTAPSVGNQRMFTLSLDFDVNSTTDDLINQLASSTQYSWAVIFAANDDQSFVSNYGGFHIVIPAMYIEGVPGVGTSNKRTANATFKVMQSTDFTSWPAVAYFYNADNADYADA